ncbi:MAG: GTP-binding protein [Proteobacteria bacterium]|nr:GTP-binding protein [Pseudomonadota bacterium]
MSIQGKVPVSILTGFLGSGKTTLLNRILSGNHGKRIAVIENEFGAINIDHGLVINADEEVFEMSNGCLCCTVRGDLIRVLGNLIKRRDKFDYVLVETTGLADPGPVAQTFFMDDDIRREFVLDGIVTLVDAGHIDKQLGNSKEAEEQVAFADVILLNKTDLLSAADLDLLEGRIKGMNKMARVYRSRHADIPVERVLDLRAFDLDETLSRRPTFLEPEYPFEWSGIYELAAGTYTLSLGEGPDPSMSLVVLPADKTDEPGMFDLAERCVRLYAQDAEAVLDGEALGTETHLRLQLQEDGRKSFSLLLDSPARLALFAQHTAEEFDLRLLTEDGHAVPCQERLWVAQHEHDAEVTSVSIEMPGDADDTLMNSWLGTLLREQGEDIFRMKGFISIAGEPRRIVFQGVHMLFDAQADRPWGSEERKNQLVFIGRNLDEQAMRRGFEACLV